MTGELITIKIVFCCIVALLIAFVAPLFFSLFNIFRLVDFAFLPSINYHYFLFFFAKR